MFGGELGIRTPDSFHYASFQVFPNKLHQRLDTIIKSHLFPRNKGKNRSHKL